MLLAVGAVILANSRFFEGFLLCVPACVYLGISLRKRSLRHLLPAVAVLVLGIAVMGYYHWRVTGNPLRMPYQENRDQYAPARIFLWEKPLPVPQYRAQTMRDFYAGWELSQFLEAKTPAGLAKNTLSKGLVFWLFFLGPAFTLPLFWMPQWVYNAAAIDDSRIVWARELDAASNRALLDYYHDRRVWLVEPDRTPAAPVPYTLAANTTMCPPGSCTPISRMP